MPNLDGPLFSIGARKSLGRIITYQKGRRKYRVGRVPTHGDRQSAGQLAQRQVVAAAVAAWQDLTPDEKAAWNVLAWKRERPI